VEQPAPRKSFFAQIGTLPANFWYANIMETFERLAFFSVSAIRALFLVAAGSANGLGLSYPQKGLILSIWALLQCLIPMVSGGYTDRYGYRKSLAVAFTINTLGYFLMAQSKGISDALGANGFSGAAFWVFLFAACLVGSGTAIFKPPVQGTIARVTTDETSSVGWGVFYWVVNIGGAVAPMAAAILRADIQWQNVFYFAAAITALNFLPAFLLYREPEKVHAADGTMDRKGPVGVFFSSISSIFKDLRLVAFLLIFSCFWLMFMQLFDLLPNFIDEWVNTSDVAGFFGAINSHWLTASGQTKPEIIVNIDAVAIVILVIPLSWCISRMHKVVAMIIGMLIAVVGFVGAGATSIGWLCCLMIFTFAIGEMMCSPTFNAYVGLIAPPDKKALYMGYANIPFAIGWALGNFLSGYAYERFSSKVNLARDYMVHTLGMSRDLITNAQALPPERVVESLSYVVKTGDSTAVHNAVASLAHEAAAGPLSAGQVKAAFEGIAGQVDAGAVQRATQLLWNAYHPQVVWYWLGAVGLVGMVGMIIFYLATRKTSAPQHAEQAA
jgi:MFS family permease